MASYIFSQIKKQDTRAKKQLHVLLNQAGIPIQQAADFTLGIFDEDYNLVATGSTFENQLHSLAVDKSHRGKGLLSQILTYLYDRQFELGRYELYLKTTKDLVPVFNSLGFFELAMAGEEVYMGNLKAVNSREAVLSA